MEKVYNSMQLKIYSDYHDFATEKLTEMVNSNKYQSEFIKVIQDIINERKNPDKDFEKPNGFTENDLTVVKETVITDIKKTTIQQSNKENDTSINLTTLIIINIIGVVFCILIIAQVVNEKWSPYSLFLIAIIASILSVISKNYKKKEEFTQKNEAIEDKVITEEKPLNTQELVTTACKIIFHRDQNYVGAIVPQFVYLNGIKIGEVKNGKTIEFSTNLKSNTITVTDHLGVAFKGAYQFEAIEGGIIEVHFDRKFK